MSENSDRSRTDVWGGGPAPTPCSSAPIPAGPFSRDIFGTGASTDQDRRVSCSVGTDPPPKGAAGTEEQSLQVYSLFIKGGHIQERTVFINKARLGRVWGFPSPPAHLRAPPAPCP